MKKKLRAKPKRRRVLLVDDDEEMGLAIGLMLKIIGDFEVDFSSSARTVVQKLLAGAGCDLIITDINMPEVSGLDLLEFLRRRTEWKNLPVIILSSESSQRMADESMQLGANGYLMKPVTINELKTVIKNSFRKPRTKFD